MSTAAAGRGPGRPRKLPVEQQREQVLRAAVAIFARTGLRGATVDGIARRAGVSRQGIYALFAGKEELFDAAAADALERAYSALAGEVLQPAEGDLVTVARRGYSRMFAFVADDADSYELLHVAERHGRPGLTRLCERLAPIYAEASRRRWAAQGIASGRADNALVAMYFAMTEALVAVSRSGAVEDREALIDLLTEFTAGGVARLMRRNPDLLDRLR